MTDHWRNILHEGHEPDRQMREIDEQEAALGEVSEAARNVRALISRFDSVTHYRAEDNLALIVDAIAAMDYEGRPSVDVLTRAWEVDRERRAEFRAVAQALRAIGEGETPEGDTPLVVKLRDLNSEQRWLAASLSRTVAAFIWSPEDAVEDMNDEEYVISVYETALGRRPSEDDLTTRIAELKSGKSRPEFMREILRSDESVARSMSNLAHQG